MMESNSLIVKDTKSVSEAQLCKRFAINDNANIDKIEVPRSPYPPIPIGTLVTYVNHHEYYVATVTFCRRKLRYLYSLNGPRGIRVDDVDEEKVQDRFDVVPVFAKTSQVVMKKTRELYVVSSVRVQKGSGNVFYELVHRTEPDAHEVLETDLWAYDEFKAILEHEKLEEEAVRQQQKENTKQEILKRIQDLQTTLATLDENTILASNGKTEKVGGGGDLSDDADSVAAVCEPTMTTTTPIGLECLQKRFEAVVQVLEQEEDDDIGEDDYDIRIWKLEHYIVFIKSFLNSEFDKIQRQVNWLSRVWERFELSVDAAEENIITITSDLQEVKESCDDLYNSLASA